MSNHSCFVCIIGIIRLGEIYEYFNTFYNVNEFQQKLIRSLNKLPAENCRRWFYVEPWLFQKTDNIKLNKQLQKVQFCASGTN